MIHFCGNKKKTLFDNLENTFNNFTLKSSFIYQ